MTVYLSREESRRVDRVAVEQFGFTGLILMENAARGATDTLVRLGGGNRIVIACGKGNNGGDGFVMARHLTIRGHHPQVVLLADPAELTGDALANFVILQRCRIPVHCHPKIDAPHRNEIRKLLQEADVMVDALLGTGAVGPPREPIAEMIRWINHTKTETNRPVFAVDLPSGLDADSGIPEDPTVRADHTLTFAAMKKGFRHPLAGAWTGTVHLHDIGIPNLVLRVARSGSGESESFS